MGVTQYIGARYVPIFADPAEWTNTRTYEPLTIVMHEGNSFTSKQYVPVGIDIDNDAFWAKTGNYNAQVEAYRQEVLRNNEKKAFAFDTVADMKASELLYNDAICHTNGFHSSGDGGAAWYVISTSGDTNEMDVIKCGELFANLVIENSVTPEMFGAWGDGTHDDSDVFIHLLKSTNYAINLINRYLISKPIAENINKSIYIFGNEHVKSWYGTVYNGEIIVQNNVSVFKNCTLDGTIENVAFTGDGANGVTSNTIQYLFDSCTINNMIINECRFINFEAIFLNTGINRVTKIINNNFLSCYYFAKRTISDWIGAVDSLIANNYINGGKKYNNNSCFQWNSLPATLLCNNFIDFYRSIFDPSANGISINVACYIKSIGDRFEAFRYLLDHVNVSYYNATFSNSHFTHLDEDAPLANNTRYDKRTITINGTEIPLDPYFVFIRTSRPKEFNVVFNDITFYDYTSKIKPINVTGQAFMNANPDSKIIFNLANKWKVKDLVNWQDENYFTYYGISSDLIETNVIKEIEEEPVISSGYNQTVFVPGCLYRYNNVIYKCIKYYSNNAWHLGLIDNFSGVPTYHN